MAMNTSMKIAIVMAASQMILRLVASLMASARSPNDIRSPGAPRSGRPTRKVSSMPRDHEPDSQDPANQSQKDRYRGHEQETFPLFLPCQGPRNGLRISHGPL